MRRNVASLLVALGMVAVSATPTLADDFSGLQPQGAVLEDAVGTSEPAVFGADCFVAGADVALSVSGPGETRLTATSGEAGSSEVSAKANAKGQVLSEVIAKKPGAYHVTASGPRTCASGSADAGFKVLNVAHTGASDAIALSLFSSPEAASGPPVPGRDSLWGQLGLSLGLVGLGSGAIWLTRRRIMRW